MPLLELLPLPIDHLEGHRFSDRSHLIGEAGNRAGKGRELGREFAFFGGLLPSLPHLGHFRLGVNKVCRGREAVSQYTRAPSRRPYVPTRVDSGPVLSPIEPDGCLMPPFALTPAPFSAWANRIAATPPASI